MTNREILFKQNDEATALFVVEAGRIRLIRYVNEDRTNFIDLVGKNEILGEDVLSSAIYSCTAIADVASRVIVYPKQSLLSALRQEPELTEDLIALQALKIESLKFRLELLNLRSARERVLLYLHYLAEFSQVTTVYLDYPLKEFANYLSITPESLSRTLAKLVQEKIITRKGRTITLHDNSKY